MFFNKVADSVFNNNKIMDLLKKIIDKYFKEIKTYKVIYIYILLIL